MQLKFRAKTPSAMTDCFLQVLETFLCAQRKHKTLWAHSQQRSAWAEEHGDTERTGESQFPVKHT